MSGKILIYGATGAVGSKCARILNEKGFDLHLVASKKDGLEKLANELRADMTVADVNDPSSFERVSNEAGKELAGLIYAVGTINLKSFRRLNEDDFISDFRINAMGAALAIRSSMSALKKGNASVVLYSSLAVGQGLPMHGSLSMAKGAIEGLVRALSAELAPSVRVNAIAPSILSDSQLSAAILKDEKTMESIAATHALKRLGTSDDIGKLSAFLISEDSSWITGQVIGVDGGKSVVRL